jgi:branched-subunit amino acid transport protein
MNDGAALWLTMLAIGAITFAIRLSFIVLLDRLHLPVVVGQALRFVPVAALTAIVVPGLLMREGTIDASPTNVRLIAGIVAIVVAWRTKNALLTIAAGMAALWAFQILAGLLT